MTKVLNSGTGKFTHGEVDEEAVVSKEAENLAQVVDGAVSISGCFDSMSNSAFYHSREVWQPMLVSSHVCGSVHASSFWIKMCV